MLTKMSLNRPWRNSGGGFPSDAESSRQTTLDKDPIMKRSYQAAVAAIAASVSLGLATTAFAQSATTQGSTGPGSHGPMGAGGHGPMGAGGHGPMGAGGDGPMGAKGHGATGAGGHAGMAGGGCPMMSMMGGQHTAPSPEKK